MNEIREPSEESTGTGHDRRGRFTPGNAAAMTHGGRSVHVRRALLAEARAVLADRRNSIISDLGGPTELSTIRTDLVERYLETSLLAEWLGGNLLTEGAVTTKGRARAAATLYLQVVDRVHRLASSLGLDRKVRDAQTIDAYVSRFREQGPEP
jgi:hypothetical protein